jgi:hypothetical protein
MRFSHWLKTLASAVVLSVSAESAMAQNPGYPGTGQPTFQPAYGTNDPGVLYPQGVPQGFNPYPAISPYGAGNVAWDQTFQDTDGLWYERILLSNREYFGSIDVTYNTIKNPGNRELGSAHIPLDLQSGGLVGYNIPTYGQGSTPGAGSTTTGTTGTVTGTPDSTYVADRRVLPYPLYIGGTLFTVNNDLFPIRGMDAFGNYNSAGIQANWGFFNEDGTGMSIGGFWTGQDTQSFTMGTDAINGIPIDQDMILTSEGRLLFTRNGAVPLNWGFFGTAAVGTNITAALGTTKYDVLFHYDTKTSVIGADTNFYFSPLVRRPGMKVRSFVGGRYMFVDDQFSFRGIDSGFIYTVTTTSGGTGGGGGGATGGSTGNSYRPDAGSLVAQYDLYEATLRNTVQSNLAGPQVGLRYDFGEGDGFRMWGQSIAGVLANREQYSLSGNNIGDQAGLTQMGTGIDMLASDARFKSNYGTTHVSPLFEQSINAEMKILEMIPGIRRLPGIEDTVFRVGYTITVVGGVARAADSIDWKGFPYFPGIDPGRQNWWASRWNFGIERRF